MAWDSSRTVPWRRLTREWLFYVVIAAAAITVLYMVTDRPIRPGLYTGLLVSGPLYVGVAAILAKFGYKRKTFKDLRAERETAATNKAGKAAAVPAGSPSAVRARPAPTKRTSSGPSQRPANKPKRR